MTVTGLSLSELVQGCREETSQYLRHDVMPGAFCFEIFRRAITARDGAAWEAVFAQYRGVVVTWVHRHPAWDTGREEDGYWVNRAFERFWGAITPDRFTAFPNVAALLRYLKLCTHSVLLDDSRTRHGVYPQPLDDTIAETVTTPDLAEEAVAHLGSAALWQTIEAEMHTETERQLAYCCFVQELKPREIAERYPLLFPDVQEVYRLKRNLLDRLQRSDAIRQFRE